MIDFKSKYTGEQVEEALDKAQEVFNQSQNYATTEFVNTAIANAITNELNKDY